MKVILLILRIFAVLFAIVSLPLAAQSGIGMVPLAGFVLFATLSQDIHNALKNRNALVSGQLWRSIIAVISGSLASIVAAYTVAYLPNIDTSGEADIGILATLLCIVSFIIIGLVVLLVCIQRFPKQAVSPSR